MPAKFLHKASVLFALCGLLLLTLLTSAGSANAQSMQVDHHLKLVVSTANARIAAPLQGVVVRTFCPAGYIALRGKVTVSRPVRVNTFALARNTFVIQFSGPTAQHRGWVSSVLNKTRVPLRVQVTAMCVLLPSA